VQKAINQSSLLFKWDTGTGKSWALAACLSYLRSIGEVKKAIILTSSIGVLNLGSELKKFMRDYDPSKTLAITSMTTLKGDERAVFDLDRGYEIIILSYSSFSAICSYYANRGKAKKVARKTFVKSPLPLKEWYEGYKGLVFMDECHLSGNHGSTRSSALLSSLPFWEYRYLFSATPADKYEKFYSILKSLDESLTQGLPYLDWLGTYCNLGTRYSRYAPDMSTWNIGKWTLLQNKLSETYIVSRDKKLLGIPDAVDMPLIEVPMSRKHRAIYEQFSNITLQMIRFYSEAHGSSVQHELVNSFQGLQMIIDNPISMLKSPTLQKIQESNAVPKAEVDAFVAAVEDFTYNTSFRKLAALKNIIEYECHEMGNKVLVFYNHPATMEILKDQFAPDCAVLSAKLKDDERFKVVENFKKSKKKILIASINIANTSFTLTECKAAIFYERTWSGIDYEQAKGRIHRIGQDSEVRYYNMAYESSIDYLQLQALESKGACIDAIGKLTSLSEKDWHTLFGGTKEELDSWLKKLD
jgi:superfamily II DNA or RNA helicase